MLGVFLYLGLICLRQGLSLNLKLTRWSDWLASEPQASSCLHLPMMRLQVGTYGSHARRTYVDTGDPHSAPHALFTEPSPQPPISSFCNDAPCGMAPSPSAALLINDDNHIAGIGKGCFQIGLHLEVLEIRVSTPERDTTQSIV